jgi:Zn-dependent M28 family amino/carboxypeptidase
MCAMLSFFLAAAISATSIKAHIDFLASDELEGRDTASRGHEIAARYVAAQFSASGLEPAGDNGTFLQRVELTTGQLDEEKSTFALNGKPLTNRKDVIIGPLFTCDPRPATCDLTLDAPIVFAGFGIVAPELGRDDYKNLDVKRKIVLVLTGAPPSFPNDERAYYSSTDVKKSMAADRGAIGFFTLKTITDEKRRSFAKAAAQASMRAMRLAGDRGEVALRASVSINNETAEKMFAGSAIALAKILEDAEKGTTYSLPLKAVATVHTVTKLGTATSVNVAARLRGGDPARANEHVAVTAHLDHIGVEAPHPAPGHPLPAQRGEGPPPDRIYNGALDNASGIAALIEIARDLAARPQRPARSIVFVAVTGEEKGELGSEYLAKHPTVSSIVADINMDMFTMLFPVADVFAPGADHSTLGPLAREAAKKAGFEFSADPTPEEVRFIRSDQYEFVKQGIPSMIFKAGMKSRDTALDGDKITRDWLRDVYHTVKDNPDQKLDYESGARWAEANLELALAAANAPEKPAWNKGDFFGAKFGGAK